MTDTEINVDALHNELNQIKTRQAEIKDKLKGYKVGRKPRSANERGGAPRPGSLTSNLLVYLADKGPLEASEIIAHFVTPESPVKSTSVRTLISAMATQGKILRSGKRGSFQYSVPENTAASA